MMKIEQLVAQKKDVVYSIRPDTHLSEALKILNDSHIEVLMVVDEHQHIEGIVSKRDILYKYSTSHSRVQQMSIKDMMTPQEHISGVQKDHDVRAVLAVMNEQRIQHLPIFDEEKVFALVSIDDVVEAVVTEAVNRMVPDFIDGQ
jgi:CBS domain-containing protein